MAEVKDDFPEIRVCGCPLVDPPLVGADKEQYDVEIHYDYRDCWFALHKDEARELANKILAYLDEGISFPLDERHGG